MTLRITDVDIVGYPIEMPDSFPVSYESHTQTEHVFIRLNTNKSYKGYGEGTALPWFTGESTEDMLSVLNRWIKPHIVDISLDNALINFDEFCREFPANSGAKAAVDMALWDLKSKRAERPLSDFLGIRRRDSVPAVHTVPGVSPDIAEEIIERRSEDGFIRFKVKATGELDDDIDRINRVLSVLPEGGTARIDANTGWNDASTTLRVVDQIENKERIEYIEQPVRTDKYEDLKYLWHETNIPIYADEAVHTPEDVERLGKGNMAAGFHLKLAKTGRLMDEVHMASIAERYGLSVSVISAFGTSLDIAANLHLAAVMPCLSRGCEMGTAFLEEDPTTNQLGHNPQMNVPVEPGIGVEIQEDVFEPA